MTLLALLFFVSSSQASVESPSCDVAVSKNISHQVNKRSIRLEASVSGRHCYEAKLALKIFSADKLAYSYIDDFKPLTAIHWEDVTEADARHFLISLTEDYNFINCSELPAVEQSGELPYFEDLLIPEEEYSSFKRSRCRAFIHTYGHYESNRIVVFPEKGEELVVVR